MNVELKFRAKGQDGEWHESDFDLSSFFYGLDDGQLKRDTLQQKINGEWITIN